MASAKIRVLFSNFCDADNFNAQSLNVRELALRLDPARFGATLFFERTPDPRLQGDARFRLVHIPPRLGTLAMLGAAYRGQDILFRANLYPFTRVWLESPAWLKRGAQMVHWLEEPAKPYFPFASPALEQAYMAIQARVRHRYAVTEFVAESQRRAYGLTCDGIIPVGVDTGRFFSPPRPPREHPTVLFVGHLMRRKAPHAVLWAARTFPQARFVLVGGKRDSFYEVVRRTAVRWRLENVTLLDPMPQAELLELMRGADVLLHPSTVEGLPKVVLEAAAAGLPAVISNRYHAPAVVDGVTGFQVGSLGEMLERLGWLLNDASLRQKFGVAAVEHVRQFDWARVADEWQTVFGALADGTR